MKRNANQHLSDAYFLNRPTRKATGEELADREFYCLKHIDDREQKAQFLQYPASFHAWEYSGSQDVRQAFLHIRAEKSHKARQYYEY